MFEPVTLKCKTCAEPIQRAIHEKDQPWVHVTDHIKLNPLQVTFETHPAVPDVLIVS